MPCLVISFLSRPGESSPVAAPLQQSHLSKKKQNQTAGDHHHEGMFASHGYINKQTPTRLCMICTSRRSTCKVSCAHSPKAWEDSLDKKQKYLPLPRLHLQAATTPSKRTVQRININHYATKKTAAQSMLDVALLMANSSQLKTVLYVGPRYRFYIPLVVLLSLSITLQVIVGLLLVFIGKSNVCVRSSTFTFFMSQV